MFTSEIMRRIAVKRYPRYSHPFCCQRKFISTTYLQVQWYSNGNAQSYFCHNHEASVSLWTMTPFASYSPKTGRWGFPVAILIKKNQNKYLSAIRTAASCLFLMIFVVVVVWVFCLFFGFSFVFFVCLFVLCFVLFCFLKRKGRKRKGKGKHCILLSTCHALAWYLMDVCPDI